MADFGVRARLEFRETRATALRRRGIEHRAETDATFGRAAIAGCAKGDNNEIFSLASKSRSDVIPGAAQSTQCTGQV